MRQIKDAVALFSLNTFNFLLQLINEVTVFVIEEISLNGDEVNRVLTCGWKIRAIENAHRIFLGSDDILALTLQLMEELKDVAEVVARIVVMIIVMDNLEPSAKLLKILSEWPWVGNARNAQNEVILIKPVERSEIRVANGEYRLRSAITHLTEIKLLKLEQVHVFFHHAQVNRLDLVGAFSNYHHVALQDAIGRLTQ